ncbi:MAG: hypothetical protein LQ342_003732 [Letrouitia transgressa]|nr:MAG: hypothetical protein LQ342_003732 [Letrouitia transgressa]
MDRVSLLVAENRRRHQGYHTPATSLLEYEEEDPLLGGEEYDTEPEDPCPQNPHADRPIYNYVHLIRREVISRIDDPYSLEQLRAPRMNAMLVRPLVDRLYELDDISIGVIQFLHEQTYHSHHQTVNVTRAILCELLANRVLRRYDEDNPGHRGLLLLANILVSGFEPFQNAPDEVLKAENLSPSWVMQRRGGYERKSTSLELAIISESKNLLSSPACQKLVEAVYDGRVVYTPVAFIDIIPDHYKYKHVALYRPRKAPLLNQYRLIVPRTRNILDLCQFMLLLTLYLLVMKFHEHSRFTVYEAAFCVYAMGWVLDELASMLEHGWQVYTQNLWSFLDFGFAAIFAAYFTLRMYDLAHDEIPGYHHRALDILATGAPVLIPRLAFNLMSENMLFVSLRAMMRNFALLTLLAVWSFTGFLLGMMWLNNGLHHPITIAKWMLWAWFGLDGSGFEESLTFHWLLGPILMVSFTVIGNTLFLTIVVAMLSNTFSTIVSNATAEISFRRAVLTFEGVKSDAIFAYQPPFNILALCFLLPLKCIVSPRWFHKINVTIVRSLNAPLLLLIALYERKYLWKVPSALEAHLHKPRHKFGWWAFSKLSIHGGIQAVFNSEPPQSTIDAISKLEGFGNSTPEQGSVREQKKSDESSNSLRGSRRIRSDSLGSTNGLTEHITSLLHDHKDNPFGERLRNLEESNKRIEDMLSTLCGGSDPEESEGYH